MSRPYFTIAIPSKNRPDRLGNAVRSVLTQTFSDLEVIICDNSDQVLADANAAIVRGFDDPRIRYIRTTGRLSMPDNWERSIADASGDFVGILSDRSVFRRNALQVVHTEIEKTGARLVNWFSDQYARNSEGEFRPRKCTLRRHRLDSDAVINFFLHGDPKFAPKVIPRLMNSVCHRSVLDAVRASPVGRCCPPVCPDYTSGFLMLAHCEWMLMLDEALFVSCGLGNGFEFRRRGELADGFMRDLGMSWRDLVDRMPSEACFTHALILNDFMRIRDALPDRLSSFELDRIQYYLGCMLDYAKATRRGADLTEDFGTLMQSLDSEPRDIQCEIRGSRLYERAVCPVPVAAKNKKPKRAAGGTARFNTVFDALAWGEANPQRCAPSSFIDLMPGIEETEPKRAPQSALHKVQSDLDRGRLALAQAEAPGELGHWARERVNRWRQYGRSLLPRLRG